jgi:pyridinium-3,5-biscarboxylic acid mononucleotide sulfurtransferase
MAETTTKSLDTLSDVIGRSETLLVAFSGGVDSAVLLAAAERRLGDRAVAFTADSPSMPRRELELAIEVTKKIGVRHIIRPTEELSLPEYAQNGRDRCYWCKHTLFETCEHIARDLGFRDIAYGYTADDVADIRPGHRAASEFGVRSPLLEAGLGKRQIREIALLLGLEVWDKPAAPCLSSRIPHGSQVTSEKLRQIEVMEDLLAASGFNVFRARFDGSEMRIELPPPDIARAASPEVRERITALARQLGIRLVTLDLEGFRSGKLNEIP